MRPVTPFMMMPIMDFHVWKVVGGKIKRGRGRLGTIFLRYSPWSMAQRRVEKTSDLVEALEAAASTQARIWRRGDATPPMRPRSLSRSTVGVRQSQTW